MTTSIWSSESPNEKYKFPFKQISILVFLITLIFVIWNIIFSKLPEKYFLVQYENITISQIRIIEIVSGHSWQTHGYETSQALDCLGRRGSTKSFKTRGFEDRNTNRNVPTNLWLCQDIDGSWYAIVTTVFEKIDGNQVARLVTAYKVAQDLFPTIDDYIQYIGQKWDARYISYIIGASQIYLQPK